MGGTLSVGTFAVTPCAGDSSIATKVLSVRGAGRSHALSPRLVTMSSTASMRVFAEQRSISEELSVLDWSERMLFPRITEARKLHHRLDRCADRWQSVVG
jgi:hypothetical protein